MQGLYRQLCWLLILGLSISACSTSTERSTSENLTGPLFSMIPVSESGITFKNEIQEDPTFNFLSYPYIYNGGGVALGDINNDGKTDIYLSANKGSNKLYLNKGNWEFEDITRPAGVADEEGWTTGISMIDINNDGYLDLYICKSGSLQQAALRKNKLFINNQKGQFTEQAEAWGLADDAFSTQAYFFDYDKDGDLDMYLVNHRPDFKNNTRLSTEIQRAVSPQTTDKLYRNDGNHFSDVTNEAGIINKAWGLSASISDFNNDGWLDIFVADDFMEPDRLLINQQNGTFLDQALEHFDHTSFYSMGSDIADFNNDLQEDLIVLDMVSADHIRSKRNMASMSTALFTTLVDIGYHHQYMANMLQLNLGDGNFAEIGHLAGVAKTDWSWAPLFADFDNDGNKDLFVTNGIKRDITDNDYKIEVRAKQAEGKAITLDELFQIVPSQKIPNFAYRNTGGTNFQDFSKAWGFDKPLHSNGAAYGDLDNDGDLDLVINNIDDFASLYANNGGNNFVQVKLKGPDKNPLGIGTQVIITTEEGKQAQRLYLARGFQSSVDPKLHFGIGDQNQIISIQIQWPDGKVQTLNNPKINQVHNISYQPDGSSLAEDTQMPFFKAVQAKNIGLAYQHQENEFDDFAREILLPQKQSTLGPKIALGDVNGDKLPDAFIGGAKGFPGSLLIQGKNGRFQPSNSAVWEAAKQYEDINALFFDADQDGDQDLYVVSGGNEEALHSPLLQDRLYLNDGSGNFSESTAALPKLRSSGHAICAGDIDQDGDLDLFVGAKAQPGKYPYPDRSYLLKNDGGTFTDITSSAGPDLEAPGLVTDATFSDYDNDGDVDLILVGEWMRPSVFTNNQGSFSKHESGLGESSGWWCSIESADLDEDGDPDFVIGNLGLNNKFGAKKDKPFHVYCSDFDDSGTLDIVLSKEKGDRQLPVRGRECSSQQMPFITEKFPTYKAFAEAELVDIYGDDKLEEALHFQTETFASAWIENRGQEGFKLHQLPVEAQFGPTLGLSLIDVNYDGHIDIVGAGAIFNAEVETIRYDASKGYVLLGDGKGEFKPVLHSGFRTSGNVKDLARIDIKGQLHLLAVSNNGTSQVFQIIGQDNQ